MGTWFSWATEEETEQPTEPQIDEQIQNGVAPIQQDRTHLDSSLHHKHEMEDYSASIASSGSGYFGDTAILGKTLNEQTDLPDNASEIIDKIQSYLQTITDNMD